jgi:RNA polymerase sigma factor (sigma-70 family)
MTKNEFVESFYRENYTVLVKIARRRVGNYSIVLAEEAVQEAFARAIKYFKTYRSASSFNDWFRRILYNTINQLKTQEMNGGVTMTESEEETTTQINIIFTKEVVDLLNQCSPRDMEILNNYFFYGFKTREISELMNVSHDVVRDRIRTFRERARA